MTLSSTVSGRPYLNIVLDGTKTNAHLMILKVGGVILSCHGILPFSECIGVLLAGTTKVIF